MQRRTVLAASLGSAADLAVSKNASARMDLALRAKVRDGQVVLWHWFEDSYAVSQAFHGR